MATDARQEHSVWDVYDQFRTARLSCKYYAAKLAALERTNFVVEVVLAASASGSAVAALTFWQTNVGKTAWTVLTVVSALLAVMKPFMKLTERIQKLEAVAVAYGLLEHDYRKLEIEIRQRRAFDHALQQRLHALMDRADDVKQQEMVERTVDEKLRVRCREEVERELPSSRFFVPED